MIAARAYPASLKKLFINAVKISAISALPRKIVRNIVLLTSSVKIKDLEFPKRKKNRISQRGNFSVPVKTLEGILHFIRKSLTPCWTSTKFP